MGLKLFTAPAKWPVLEHDVQRHLRLSDDEFAETISDIRRLIYGATAYVQHVTWRALITQTWDLYLDQFPSARQLLLPHPPLQTVTGVYYTAQGSTEATFTGYTADIISEPGRVVLNAETPWPSVTLIPANGFRVRFTCGYGDDPEDVPSQIIQAILLHITQEHDGVDMRGAIENMLVNYSVRHFI